MTRILQKNQWCLTDPRQQGHVRHLGSCRASPGASWSSQLSIRQAGFLRPQVGSHRARRGCRRLLAVRDPSRAGLALCWSFRYPSGASLLFSSVARAGRRRSRETWMRGCGSLVEPIVKLCMCIDQALRRGKPLLLWARGPWARGRPDQTV